jgi:hypothetical protein
MILPHSTQLWDLAGVDGRSVMQALFGPMIDRIAPFQSLDTTLDSHPCAILRLCEGNFRIAWSGDSQIAQRLQAAQIGQRVWCKPLRWLTAIGLPASAHPQLLALAKPKPPHRLEGLPLNCAVPARLDGTAVLIWRQARWGQPGFELHTAWRDRETIQAKLAIALTHDNSSIER